MTVLIVCLFLVFLLAGEWEKRATRRRQAEHTLHAAAHAYEQAHRR